MLFASRCPGKKIETKIEARRVKTMDISRSHHRVGRMSCSFYLSYTLVDTAMLDEIRSDHKMVLHNPSFNNQKVQKLADKLYIEYSRRDKKLGVSSPMYPDHDKLGVVIVRTVN
jgi:hypothetical protein